MLHILKNCRQFATDTWFSPKTTQKLFKPHPEKTKRRLEQKEKLKKKEKQLEIMPKFEEIVTDTRFNSLNIQMLPRDLYNQVFHNYTKEKLNFDLIQSCQRELEKHGMVAKETQFLDDIKLNLPELKGKNLEEHFESIGRELSEPYLKLAQKLLGSIPKKPNIWIFREGWVRYSESGPESVEYPLEEDLVFDVEVAVTSGQHPILATAVSSKAWYSWVSESLINLNAPVSKQYHEDDLIPMESTSYFDSDYLKKPKIVIGHNVSYDRARIKEQYWLNRTGTRFIDTMSLHICISGMTSYQRAMIKSKKETVDADEWKAFSSLNNLSDVYKLYCQTEVSKDPREVFVKGTLKDVRDDFQNLMDYCAGDVTATHGIFQKVFPMFLKRFPHPVTFAGMLELSTAYLPINQNWNRYIEECDLTYEELEIEGKTLLGKRADEACYLMHGEKYKEDIWMWDQDWSTKELKIKKIRKESKKEKTEPVEIRKKTVESNNFSEDEEEIDNLATKFKYFEEMSPTSTLLPGYPNWYRKLAIKPEAKQVWTPGPHLISTSMQITPKLLNLTWEGYPLHFIRGLGWGLLVPFTADFEDKTIPIKSLLEKCPLIANKDRQDYIPLNIRKDVEDNLARKEFYSKLKEDRTDGLYKGSGIWCNTILEDCIFFFKLPHKNGTSSRVGNPLAKDFLNKFSENVLAGDSEIAERVLDIARNLSYWRNNRDRIKQQMVVWQSNNFGAIIPQIVVSGTLTRRAVEATWMTASTPQKNRIGSELRAMVQAPKGYKFVGADVDSQELWIASMIGDAQHAKLHGATPFGWMTLSGTKSEGTDMHSVTAKAVGISRDHAKVINYARIYGAGQNFAEQLLKQFNPSISEKEARSKAVKMFDLTKGKRVYQLRPEYTTDLADIPYNKWQAHKVAKLYGKTLNDMFHKPRWVGGTESAMFNSLEDIASQTSPSTPFLGARLSRALEPLYNPDDKFLPTRVNWVVQSGAVDFLHLMLVCMQWLVGDKVRFSLSFHDEVRYLVKDEDRYDAALAMHITNLLTRSFCAIKLGIYDLPYSVAFFSSVEIDTALRKESKQDCKTPSNPYGLEKGYLIPNGESLTIYDAIKKSKM